MGLSFLTPTSGLVALAVVLPLAAFGWAEWRRGRVRDLLAVAAPRRRSRTAVPLAITAVAVLGGGAVMQPVLDRTRARSERTDAEVVVVLDSSRSMLAAPSRGTDTRFDRAKDLARDLGRGLPGIPIGVSSLTDRVLPHLFPTPDHGTFFATLERVVGIERPPPSGSFATVATTLGALSAVANRGFFSPGAKNRALVVLTDAETQPVVPARLAALFRRRPAIETFFVHVWDGDERIYAGRVPEPGYLPDPTSPDTIRRLAEGLEGRAFDEDDGDGVIDAVRDAIGSEGETRRIEEKEKYALAPYVMAGAFLPLAFVLVRRNL